MKASISCTPRSEIMSGYTGPEEGEQCRDNLSQGNGIKRVKEFSDLGKS